VPTRHTQWVSGSVGGRSARGRTPLDVLYIYIYICPHAVGHPWAGPGARGGQARDGVCAQRASEKGPAHPHIQAPREWRLYTVYIYTYKVRMAPIQGIYIYTYQVCTAPIQCIYIYMHSASTRYTYPCKVCMAPQTSVTPPPSSIPPPPSLPLPLPPLSGYVTPGKGAAVPRKGRRTRPYKRRVHGAHTSAACMAPIQAPRAWCLRLQLCPGM
jgi:hypothetical protein